MESRDIERVMERRSTEVRTQMSLPLLFVARRTVVLLVLACSASMCTGASTAVAATRPPVIAR